MSEKLYLIRVDMERFIGPLTLREVRDSYRRMEFGLQDEIAASNRAWVAFDDLERVKRYYPELVSLIKKEMLSGWGSTNPSSIRIRKDKEDTSISRKTVGLFTKIAIMLAVSFISFVVFYIIRENRITDFSMLFKDPLLSQAIFLYGDDYNVRFEAFMDRNREEIAKNLKNRSQLESWLPYIRAVAYQRDGSYPGIPSRTLRGKDVEFSPAECSLASWKKRWDSSHGQWQSLLSGSAFPTSDWARILVWDTDWIRYRTVQEKQWLSPSSYYEACMNMALKALAELSQAKDTVEAEVFRSRLKWKLNLLRGNSSDTQFQMSGSLWVLSCIESAEHPDEIKNCLSSLRLGREWTRFLEHRGFLREARIIISENSIVNRDQLDRLRFLIDKVQSVDPFTRFDYSEEKKLFQLVIDKSGHVASAVQAANQQNQLFRFDY